MAAALVLAAGLLLGGAALRALGLRAKDDALAWWAYAWLLGALGIGAIELAALLCGVRVAALPWIVVALAVVAAGGSLLFRRTVPAAGQAPPPARSPGIVVSALVACLLVADLALRADNEAISLGDEANVWSLRGTALFVGGDLRAGTDLMLGADGHVVSPGYPLLNPLMHLAVHAFAGELQDATSRVPVQAFVIATLLLLAAGLRRVCGPAVASVLVLAVALSREFRIAATVGAADGMITAYALGLACALDGFRRATQDGSRGTSWLVLAGACGAGLAFTKFEGVIWVVAAVAAFALSEREVRKSLGRTFLLAVVPALVVLGETLLRDARFGIHPDALHDGIGGALPSPPGVAEMASRLPYVFRCFLTEGVVVFPRTHGLVALALLLGLAGWIRWKGRSRPHAPERPFVLLTAGMLVAFALLYARSAVPVAKQIEFSIGRLLLQVLPVAALAIGAAVGTRAAVRPPQ